MIFEAPAIDELRSDRLVHLDELLEKLGDRVARAGPWVGLLRRTAQAEASASSVEIEGYSVSADRRIEIASSASPSPQSEGERALACYSQAMDHVATLARDRHFDWSLRVILDLHYEACRFQPDKDPGLLRPGPIYVTAPEGGIAYTGPEADAVPSLLEELVTSLRGSSPQTHVVVSAAMIHLNLVSIHPFQDGNGRIARIAQSLELACRGIVSPELSSIETHIARDTPAYYAVLREVQGGAYAARRDPSPWVDYCIGAHIERAEAAIDHLDRAAARWSRLENVIRGRVWDERLVIALEQALAGGSSRASYAVEADVSMPTATADLKRLSDAGLLNRTGGGRATTYLPTDALREIADPGR